MNREDTVKVEYVFGTVESVPTYKIEGGTVYLGGYSIHRDRQGNELSRTEPRYNCKLIWE